MMDMARKVRFCTPSYAAPTGRRREGMQKSTKCELECVTKLVATNIPKSGATVLKIPIEAYVSPITVDYRKRIVSEELAFLTCMNYL